MVLSCPISEGFVDPPLQVSGVIFSSLGGINLLHDVSGWKKLDNFSNRQKEVK
jgi:hypothetical protein